MLIDSIILDALTKDAKVNPILRKNYDLRNSEQDQSQRMLNAVEPGTKMPIHRHPETSTTVIVLRGSIQQYFYDEEGCLQESVVISANLEPRAIQIEKGRWHNLESLEEGTILFEAKDGPWKPYELF